MNRGKKLLILGGTSYICNVVKIARSMGVYSIVVDPLKDSPAKSLADKSYDHNTLDVDWIVEMSKKEKIDGVMTGYSDVNLIPCRRICDQLSLPFYATMEQIECTINKKNFKQLCVKYDVPVVDEYNEKDNIKYPVIVKPSDSYGSKGITVCYDKLQLNKGIEKAKLFSKKKSFVIEEYMSCDDVNIDYIIQDGKIMLSAVGDRYVSREQKGHSPLSLAVVYPSKYINEYLIQINKKVCNMFKGIDIKNGTIFIQSFFNNGIFKFFEMGFRPGGGQSSILLSKINGIDYIKCLINYALNGKMSQSDISIINNPFFNKSACGLVILIKPGVISSIEGLDEIKNIKEVVNITQFYNVGDEVKPEALGTLGQSFARIHFVADNHLKLKEAIDKVQEMLKIKSVLGFNMKLIGFDTSVLE